MNCWNCGYKNVLNRLDKLKSLDQLKCGKCKSTLGRPSPTEQQIPHECSTRVKFNKFESCLPAKYQNDAYNVLTKLLDSEEIINEISANDHARIKAEHHWIACDRPYYKVFPNMISILENTNLDIQTQDLSPSDDAWVLLFPTGEIVNHILCEIFYRVATDDLNVNTYLSIFLTHSENKKSLWKVAKLPDDVLISETNLLDTSTKGIDSGISPDQLNKYVNILIGVILLSSNGQYVYPDFSKTQIQRYHRKNKPIVEADVPKKKYVFGSEIDLFPTPGNSSHNSTEPSGRQLTNSHLRRGHIRMQPCGKNRSQTRMVLIPPTIVKPDLPALPTKKGVKIRA